MAAGTLISVDEYLRSAYDPDREYVDGAVLERNVGEYEHGRLQLALGAYFFARRKRWNIYPATEVRVQVSATRFRVPDIVVAIGSEPARVLTEAPFLCVEILSPEDRAVAMQKKIADYLAFGVRYVWVIDPETLQSWVHTASGSYEAKDGILKTENPEIVVPLPEVFA